MDGGTLQYPTGIGVALFGADGWTVKNNNIFGNFKWGVAEFSDPFNDGDDAISQNNQVLNNQMGRNGTDTNGHYDFWVDGSGRATASQGNDSSMFAPTTRRQCRRSSSSTRSCPVPDGVQPNAGATGDQQRQRRTCSVELVGYVDAPIRPRTSSARGPSTRHPPFKDYEPLNVTPGPDCP